MILAIDTSAEFASVAIGDENGVLAEETLPKKRSAEGLLEVIDQFVTRRGLPNELAVSVGPGSYTGVRIGFSLAQGLAAGWDIPLIAVSSLLSKLVLKNPAEGIHEVSLPSRPGENFSCSFKVIRADGLVVEELGEITTGPGLPSDLSTARGVLFSALQIQAPEKSLHFRRLNRGEPLAILYGKPVQGTDLGLSAAFPELPIDFPSSFQYS